MRDFKYVWVLVCSPRFSCVRPHCAARLSWRRKADPWTALPPHPQPTDHRALLKGPFDDGPAVTAACLSCHEDAAQQVMHTSHWTWESEPVLLPGRDEPVTTGKKNSINNFCIGIQSNWPSCTTCHAGYGWKDADFDFSDETAVDCLVCHDTSGQYAKTKTGIPAEGVDLVAAAQSAGIPTRQNCGSCHFSGGGGDAVKHGDLDQSLFYPAESIDVHMGRHNFLCIDCHRTTDHLIGGRSISVSVDDTNNIACTDCHSTNVHADERLNAHTDAVACQTCHIPEGAVQATKMHWDWSTAGKICRRRSQLPQNQGQLHLRTQPCAQYHWFNGSSDRYILGDLIDPEEFTPINQPLGDLHDADAKIWPFKVHRASQIYDAEYDRLIVPKDRRRRRYWTEFDWDLAARLGASHRPCRIAGPGFAPTEMYWPLSHMVAPTAGARSATTAMARRPPRLGSAWLLRRSLCGKPNASEDWSRNQPQGKPHQ